MKKLLVIMVVGFIVTGLMGLAFAAGNADEAKALVEKGIAFYKANGKDNAMAEINNPKGQFVKGELYIFVVDLNGMAWAHGGNQKLVGKDMIGLKDADGKPFIKDMVELAKSKGSGWADYKWTNPITKKIEDKTTFVKKVDDLIFGCGIYK